MTYKLILFLKHPNQLLFSAKLSIQESLKVAMPKILELGNFWAGFLLFICFQNLLFENILYESREYDGNSIAKH